MRWSDHGSPTATIKERNRYDPENPWAWFWSQVDKEAPGGCWYWTGHQNELGYPMIGVCWFPDDWTGARRRAHRVAYQLLKGPTTRGHVLDHLCEIRHCVNPAHLEEVTPYENYRRRANRNA